MAEIVFVVFVCFFVFRTAYPSVTLRYRLVLEMVVDGKTVTPSSVEEVTYEKLFRFLGASSDHTSYVRGEALHLDLGQRGTLFALLAANEKNLRSDPDFIIPILFGVTTGGISSDDINAIGNLKGDRELKADQLPTIVIMETPANPSLVKFIAPADYPILVAEGVEIRAARIEIVDGGFWPLNILGVTGTPLTTGIAELIPWIDQRSDRTKFWDALSASGY